MDPGTQTLTAREVVNTYTEADLTRILRTFGDEKHATQIARAIVRARAKEPIETTLMLAEIVRQAIPARDRRSGRHPARKAFQAVRIEVNRETEVLERGLEAAIRWASPGARICVISYHSLEDRIVKHVFSKMSQGCICPPDLPVCVCGHVPIIEVKTKRPLVASEDEVTQNPRARSALMRVAKRLDTSGE
jgi:16S rRNA (cytosine1402-N4)-methyltransferase